MFIALAMIDQMEESTEVFFWKTHDKPAKISILCLAICDCMGFNESDGQEPNSSEKRVLIS